MRDLRQVLASVEKKFRQNPDKYRPIESHANLSGTTTLKRAVFHLQSPPVGLALDRIQEIHQRGWNKKILFVRYKDLTAQSRYTMQQIYGYLGLPEYPHNFDKVIQVTMEDDQIHGIPGFHEIRSRMKAVQNDYLSVLGKDTIRFVQNNWAWYFTLFEYRVTQV